MVEMDFEKADKLWAQLREAEAGIRRFKARIHKIKMELAPFVGADVVAVPPASKEQQHLSRKPTARNSARAAANGTKKNSVQAGSGRSGPVGEGTKGRLVLEIVQKLGGKAPAKAITRQIPVEGNVPTMVHSKRVRSYLRYMLTLGYLIKTARGVWEVTEQGRAALGVNARTQEGHPMPG